VLPSAKGMMYKVPTVTNHNIINAAVH